MCLVIIKMCVFISPNNDFIASASQNAFLWDRKTMKLIFEFKYEGWVNSFSFHPIIDYLITGSNDNKVRIFDIRKKILVHVLEGHFHFVNSVFCSYDGI